MNAEQVSAYVNAHKPVVLGAAAAGVVGLALLKRKKAGATPAAAGSVGTQPAGTIPAAAVVPSQQTASTYDSSAYDVYNALSGQLEQLRQTTGGGTTPVTAPAPVASTLFAPSGSGSYVRGKNGAIAEVESDGSLFGLTGDQWGKTSNASYTQLSGELPFAFTTEQNLQLANAPKAKA